MYREFTVSLEELRSQVARACDDAWPLGAYASKELFYLFLESGGIRALRARLQEGVEVPSVIGIRPLYDWHEREMWQDRGVGFDALPDMRPLYFDASAIPVAHSAQGKGVSVVVVGPVHAGVIEPGRFTFSTGGETVIHLDAQLSYSHRGVERALEGRAPDQALAGVARICASCTVARSVAYARAVEALAGFECDAPSQYARVVFAELERLHCHLFDLANAAAGAGFGRGTNRGFELKERVLQICAMASGHRLLFDAIALGGVRAGTLLDPKAISFELERLHPEIDRYLEELYASTSTLQRFERTGVLARDVVEAFGGVGPAARASGVAMDVREISPYGAYRDLGVKAVTARSGDVFARCDVKRREIHESLRLLSDALNELGAAAPEKPKDVRAASGSITTIVEGARGAETISIEICDDGRLQRFHAISSSHRNWPLVTRAMEDAIIPDFPLVNKSFNLCYACVDR